MIIHPCGPTRLCQVEGDVEPGRAAHASAYTAPNAEHGDPPRSSRRRTPTQTECAPTAQTIAAHLPLVRRVVTQLARRLPANVHRDDLFSAGVFGLVDSLRRNGGDHGATFEWYARMRIRGAVFDELRAQDWLSRRTR